MRACIDHGHGLSHRYLIPAADAAASGGAKAMVSRSSFFVEGDLNVLAKVRRFMLMHN